MATGHARRTQARHEGNAVVESHAGFAVSVEQIMLLAVCEPCVPCLECARESLLGGWHMSAPALQHTLPAVLLFRAGNAQAVLGLQVVLCVQALLRCFLALTAGVMHMEGKRLTAC